MHLKFKAGDKVKCVWNDNGTSEYVGLEGDVRSLDTGAGCKYPYNVQLQKNGHTVWFSDKELQKITDTQMSTIIQKAAMLFKGEPEKSFIKAGIMDSQETLTDEGVKVVLGFVLKHDKDLAAAFKKEVVDPIIAEDAAAK